ENLPCLNLASISEDIITLSLGVRAKTIFTGQDSVDLIVSGITIGGGVRVMLLMLKLILLMIIKRERLGKKSGFSSRSRLPLHLGRDARLASNRLLLLGGSFLLHGDGIRISISLLSSDALLGRNGGAHATEGGLGWSVGSLEASASVDNRESIHSVRNARSQGRRATAVDNHGDGIVFLGGAAAAATANATGGLLGSGNGLAVVVHSCSNGNSGSRLVATNTFNVDLLFKSRPHLFEGPDGVARGSGGGLKVGLDGRGEAGHNAAEELQVASGYGDAVDYVDRRIGGSGLGRH
ncbi:hypothetical protein B0T09DRAFT_390919, partial [Sordaria sp. MPI-SDFR-AT-0083]